MGILGDFVINVTNGALQSAAAKSASQPVKKGRKAKKGGFEGCTPCAAMANADAHRQRLGYSIK